MAFEVIAHGYKTRAVPGWVTINTGKYSPDPEKVEVRIKYGNKDEQLVLSDYVPMHGVWVTYEKLDSLKKTIIRGEKSVTIYTTGAWRVEVENPR